MTDFQVLIEFCERFNYECLIFNTADGGCKVYMQGDEFYFDADGDLCE